ncbi:MAG: gliding motility-associated C-terminal domain-containing protein [Candidatus Zixiibacteriota bacterium]
MKFDLRVWGLFFILFSNIVFSQSYLDDAYFFQETDCDGQSLVEICFETSGDSVFSYASIRFADSVEFIPAFESYFTSLDIADGDLGGGTYPGLHCFEWDFGADLPNIEDYFDLAISIHEDDCCSGDSLSENGSLPEMLFAGDYGFESDTELDPEEDYLEGDIMTGLPWFRGNLTEDTLLGGTELPGFIEFGDRYGWRRYSHGYAHFYICSEETDTTVYLWARKDDDMQVWLDGELIFEDRDHMPNLLSSEGPPDMIPMELSACEWHSVYIWIYNRFDYFALSHKIVDASGEPITSLQYSLDPMGSMADFDSLHSTTFLDSKPPNVNIDCVFEPLPIDVDFTYEWTIEDISMPTEQCSVFFKGCGIDESFDLYDNTIDFTATEACENCTLIVTARDSFCNQGADTCILWFYEDEEPDLIPSIDSAWFSEETYCDGENFIEICYILSVDSADIRASVSADSGASWIEAGDSIFSSISDDENDLGPGVLPGEHCFTWHLSEDWPDIEISDLQLQIGTGAAVALVDSFSSLDTTVYTINGNDGFVDSDSGYFVLTQDRNWRNGRLLTVDSVLTDTLQVSFRFKLQTEDSRGADGVSLILTRHANPPLAWGGQLGISQTEGWGIGLDTWENCCDIDGNHLELSIDDTCCLAGSQPIPTPIEEIPIAEELIDGEWHHVFLDINYPHIEVRFDGFTFIDGEYPELEPFWAYTGFSASTGSAHSSHIIDDFVIFSPHTDIMDINFIAEGPIDSRPPRIEIFSESDTALGGDSLSINFASYDLFPDSEAGYHIFVDYCGIVDSFFTEDTIFDFIVMPNLCDSIEITVQTADSFCNIGQNSIIVPVINFDYAAEAITPLPGQISACRDQNIRIDMTEPPMINWDILELYIDDMLYTIGSDELYHIGDTLIFQPSGNWEHGENIEIRLYQSFPYLGPDDRILILDYSFMTDFQQPVLSLQNPTHLSVTRETSPDIAILAEDDMSEIDASEISICVYGDNCFTIDNEALDIQYDGNSATIILSLEQAGLVIPNGDSANIHIEGITDSPDLCIGNASEADWVFYTETKICNAFPNPFSPNADGYNDHIHFIYPGQEIDDAELIIFDKRHSEVYRSDIDASFGYYNTGRSFDGIDGKNSMLPPGLYIYIIMIDGEKVCEGTFTLIR